MFYYNLFIGFLAWVPNIVWGKVNLGGMESWGFNGIRSGMVTLMSPNKLYIRGLDYTGEGPAVWFMVGMEDDPYNEEFADLTGTIIPDENGSCDKLQRYRNENIMLTLPRGMNFTNYDYLAVYCTRFNHNFGYVHLKRDVQFDTAASDEKLPKPCPQDHLEDEEEDEEKEEEKEEEEKENEEEKEEEKEEEEEEEEDDSKRRKRKNKKFFAAATPKVKIA